MIDALTEPQLKTSQVPEKTSVRRRIRPSQPVVDALVAALAKQLKLLEDYLRSARDGDADAVRAARGAIRRIAVILDAMRGTSAIERTAKLRRRIAEVRRSLEQVARYDALSQAAFERRADSVRELERRREQAHAKLRRRLASPRTDKTLVKLRRLAAPRDGAKEGLGLREAASLLLRRSCDKVCANAEVASAKKRDLKRLERNVGRLLYTLELFAGVLTGAGNRLRCQLAEAQAHLAELREAEIAYERQPSLGRRRRRDTLRLALADKVSFLAGKGLRDDVEAAIGSQ